MQISQILRIYKTMMIGGVSQIIHHLIKDKTMKLSKLFAGLLSLSILGACSKDTEPTAPVSAPKTQEVMVTISTQPDNELRGLFERNETTGAVGKLKMVEKDVVLYIAVKAGDAGEPVYQKKTFTKVPGENRAVYSGQLTIPVGTPATDYKISAVLVSEDGGLEYVQEVTSMPERLLVKESPAALEAATGNTINLPVPYYTDWTPCTLSSTGVLDPITLSFKPEGTVLRVQVKNLTESVQDLKSISFETTAFRVGGTYNFKDYDQGRPALLYKHEVPTYTFPASTSLSAQSAGDASVSPYYYIWVAPLEGGDVPFETIVNIEKTDATKLSAIFMTNQAMPRGSVPLRISITNKGVDAVFDGLDEVGVEGGSWGIGSGINYSKSPIEYFAAYDVNLDGSAFVENIDNADPNVGFFTALDAYARFANPVTIGGKQYSLPTYSELLSIIPPALVGAATSGDARNLNVIEKNVKLGSITRTFLADYQSRGSGRRYCYAIRFKGADDVFRTAFRYRYVSEAGKNRIEITTRHIGKNPDIDIDDVEQSTFWSTNNANDKTMTISFRGAKVTAGIPGTYDIVGNGGFFWTQSMFDENTFVAAFFGQYSTRVWGFNKADNRFPVRLYLRD